MENLEEVFVPVFIPETIIDLMVSPRIMIDAIFNFNSRVEAESMVLQSNNDITGSITELVRLRDNLFLHLFVPAHNRKKAHRLQARLMGYVVMHKETGVVEDLVIEGFTFGEATNVEDRL